MAILADRQTSLSPSENFTWYKLHFAVAKLHHNPKLFPKKIRLLVLTYQKLGIYVNIHPFVGAFLHIFCEIGVKTPCFFRGNIVQYIIRLKCRVVGCFTVCTGK